MRKKAKQFQNGEESQVCLNIATIYTTGIPLVRGFQRQIAGELINIFHILRKRVPLLSLATICIEKIAKLKSDKMSL